MLTVVGGPMFSGKTSWLLGYIHSLTPGTYELFKPDMDTRFAIDEIVSHAGQRMPAKNLHILSPEFPNLPDTVGTILIDELNFFDPQTLVPEIEKQLQKGKTIVTAGLLYDFAKNPFGATLPLSQHADRFIQLYARCDNCGQQAHHSYRKTHATSQIVLGASETYGPTCEICWETLSSFPSASLA